MSIAFLEQHITGGNQATFNFGQPIGAYVYGIRRFCLASGTPGGYLQDYKISYTPADGTGVNYEQVTLQQQIAPGLDPENTWADVVVLALLGGPAPQDALIGNDVSLPLGASGGPYVLSSPLTASCSVLGGFALHADSNSADLNGIGAAVGMDCWPTADGAAYSPAGTATLIGDTSASGTIDVGHLLISTAQPGIWLAALSADAPAGNFSVSFGGPVRDATVLVQSFYTQWDTSNRENTSNTYFTSLTVGADNISVEGNNATGTFGIDFEGLVDSTSVTYYGGGETTTQPASVTVAVGSAVVVGIA